MCADSILFYIFFYNVKQTLIFEKIKSECPDSTGYKPHFSFD